MRITGTPVSSDLGGDKIRAPSARTGELKPTGSTVTASRTGDDLKRLNGYTKRKSDAGNNPMPELSAVDPAWCRRPNTRTCSSSLLDNLFSLDILKCPREKINSHFLRRILDPWRDQMEERPSAGSGRTLNDRERISTQFEDEGIK